MRSIAFTVACILGSFAFAGCTSDTGQVDAPADTTTPVIDSAEVLRDVPTTPGKLVREAPSLHVFPIELLSVLRHAETFELISLDPDQEGKEPPDFFYGVKTLGSTKITDQATRDRLIAMLRRAVEKEEVNAAKCHWPHHGMRAVHDGQTVELSICFSCERMDIYVDNKWWGTLWVIPRPKNCSIKCSETRRCRSGSERKNRSGALQAAVSMNVAEPFRPATMNDALAKSETTLPPNPPDPPWVRVNLFFGAMGALLFLLVTAAIVPSFSAAVWSGHTNLTIEFVVTDESSGLPVPQTNVEIVSLEDLVPRLS